MMTTSVSVMKGSSCSTVVPGWSEGPDPESRDSGFASSRRPGMTFYIRHFSLQHHETIYCPFRRLVLHCARPASAGLSRSSHGFDRATRRHGAAVLVTQPAAADGLYGRDLRQCAAAVFGAAAVHQNGAAAARRLAGGVVGGDGVLPVAAARRLCLRALSDATPQPHDSGGGASGAADRRAADAAAVDCERVGRTTGIRLCLLAAGPVRGLDRAAVLRTRRQQSVAAGLVRPHRPSQWSGPVLSLCLLEYRQFSGAVVLSGAAGADVHAAHAKPDLDRRLRAADPADRGLRGAAAALAGDRRYRCADRSDRR